MILIDLIFFHNPDQGILWLTYRADATYKDFSYTSLAFCFLFVAGVPQSEDKTMDPESPDPVSGYSSQPHCRNNRRLRWSRQIDHHSLSNWTHYHRLSFFRRLGFYPHKVGQIMILKLFTPIFHCDIQVKTMISTWLLLDPFYL